MTDLLLPTLPSDDENDHDDAAAVVEEDDDDDSMCMDESFTLNQGTYVNDIVAQTTSDGGITGWSFQNALNRSNNNVDNDQDHTQPLRMDIDAIIAAKRKDIIQQNQPQSETKQVNVKSTSDKGENDENSSEEDSSDDNDDSDEDDDDADDDDDDDDDVPNIVDDEHLQQEDDVLTTRLTKRQKKQERANQPPQTTNPSLDDENDEKEEDDEEDVEDDSDEDEDDEEEDDVDYETKREASKANAFYDTETSRAVSQKQNNNMNSNSMTGFDDNNNNNNSNNNSIQAFNQLPLCRPLLRGIAAMGFVQPTPIQSAVIPLVLNGRDICASAVTGSGKTAAFVVPIAERIIHRSSSNSAYCCTRALILTPTRELAAQCYGMMSTFIQYTKLRASLIVGGSKNNTSQATELRTRPDFIVATPGRLLDHVTNSTGCTLVDIEFLILDEADRLLDLGFSDEIMEIVKSCPIQRQTLLFSATMNTKVDDLIHLSLKNPVRVKISDQNGNDHDTTNGLEVAPRLEQEFIRIRASNEGVNREGILLGLLTRTYKTQVICFFDTKVTAHRMMILAGLCGIRCAELHGNLTQPQRLTALEDFRSGNVDVLLATDLAARGLDINRVQTVINFEMPSQLATYIHRIGRTARAGRGGRSCTLIGEGRRHLMKELLKESSNKKKKPLDSSSTTNPDTTKGVILSRTVPSAVISHFAAKIQSLEVHYEEVLQAETVAKLDRIAEMEVTRAQNLIEHADEIKQRPAKEWFVSNAEKQQGVLNRTKESKNNDSTADKPTGMHRMTRKKRRAREVREAMEQGDDTNEGDIDQPQSKSVNDSKIKSDVRKQKRLQAEMKYEKSGLSIHDIDMQEEKKLLKKTKKKNTSTNSNDAAGDSNLFGEEKVSFATSGSKSKRSNGELESEDRPARSTYKFVGYNPDKKLGRKKSHNSFKSKSKHKRR